MSAISGTGVSLSGTYYKRTFYADNRDAATSSKRSAFGTSNLASADAAAIRRAVKKLRSFSFDDDNSTNIRNSVSAYVETYNNLLASGEKTGDRSVQRAIKQMKNLTSTYEDELDDIGITVNSDGTLTTRSTLLSSADISKFEKLFSKDSAYMQKAASYTKRLQKSADELVASETRQKNALNEATKTTSPTDTASTEAAQIVASALQLEQTTNGLGSNINLYL
jgi:hypothetical protein